MKKISLSALALLLAGALSLAGVVYYYQGEILKRLLVVIVNDVLGFDTHAGSVRYVYPSTFLVRDFQVDNPPGFRRKIFAKASEVELVMDIPKALRRERFHFYKMQFHIDEIHFEKNKKGVSNTSLLRPVQEANEPEDLAQPPSPRKFFLDRLVLTIHWVTYEDWSGIIPKRVGHNIRVEDHVFENVRSLNAVIDLILLKIIYGKTFGTLGLNHEKVENMFWRTVSSGGGLFKAALDGATAKTKEELTGLVGKLKTTLAPKKKAPSA